MLKRVELGFNKYQLVAVVLLLLVMPFMTTGRGVPFLPIALVLLFLGSFMLARLPKLKPIDKGLLFWGYLGLLAWSVASLTWSVNRYFSAIWIINLAIAGGAFGLAYQLKAKREALNLFVKGYLVGAAAFGLYGLWLYVAENYQRVTSTFYMANPMAIYLLPAVLLGLWYWANSGKKFYLATSVVTGVAFYLTYSRTSFLLLILVALAAGVRVRRKTDFWQRLGLALVIVAIAATGINFTRAKLGKASIDATSRLVKLNEDASTQTSGSDRIYYLKSAAAIWQDNPVIGTGAGTYRMMHPQYQYRPISVASHAHNFYAQTLSELGVVGAGLVIVILVGLGQAMWRTWQKDRGLIPMVVVAGLLVVHLGLDIDSSFTVLLALVGAFAGLGYTAAKKAFQPRPARWALGFLVLLIPALSLFNSHLHKERAVFLQSLGDYAEAASEFKKASTGIIFDPSNLTGEGINYYTLAPTKKDAQTYYKLAEERAMKATTLSPRDSQHYFLLGRSLRRMGELLYARQNFEKALELDPYNQPDYYLDLAVSYLEPNPAKTVEVTGKALAQYTDEVLANRHIVAGYAQSVARIHSVMAEALRKLERPEEAQQHENKAKEIRDKYSAPSKL